MTAALRGVNPAFLVQRNSLQVHSDHRNATVLRALPLTERRPGVTVQLRSVGSDKS